VHHFYALRLALGGAAASTEGTRADRPTVESCLGTAALAMACVMAGSGHLGSLRLLRVLRRCADNDVSYGFHMSISMAIGLLFLGGGRLTLGTSKAAVAALVTSLFPRFPLAPTDGRYHLQALRHLYVLAAEARCLEAVDVDTGEPAMIPLRLVLRGRERRELLLSTPCQLPPRNSIESLTLASPRYWGRSLLVRRRPDHAAALRQRVLWVKRKTGHLPYKQDAHGLSSIFCRPFGSAAAPRETSLSHFCSEPAIRAFAQHLCRRAAAPAATPAATALTASPDAVELHTFCDRLLYECLTQEKPDLVPAYLLLYHTALRLQRNRCAVGMRSLRLLLAHAEARDDEPLQRPFLRSLCHHVLRAARDEGDPPPAPGASRSGAHWLAIAARRKQQARAQ